MRNSERRFVEQLLAKKASRKGEREDMERKKYSVAIVIWKREKERKERSRWLYKEEGEEKIRREGDETRNVFLVHENEENENKKGIRNTRKKTEE